MSYERIQRAQHAIRTHGLDGLIVTHPPNLRYLTGLSASAGAALLTSQDCVLIVDFRYASAARALLPGRSDLSVHVAAGSPEEAWAEILRQRSLGRVGVEAEHLSLAQFNRLTARVGAAGAGSVGAPVPALIPTDRLIERLRAVKDPAEIATIREAARRLSAVARRAREWVRPGQSELQVAASVDAAVREAGFERPAFETIVASGPNAALPHARPTPRLLQEGEGVVLDFGGVYDGYCVDLTRTLHIGAPSAQFRRLFGAVRDAHAAAIAAVRPGALPGEIDAAARRVLDQQGLGEGFGHGTGHGLGLEVHEEPRIGKLAPGKEPVVAGMIFTIEPGVYVAGAGGVRIEDDVLVVEGGCEILTDVPIDF